VNAQQYAIQPRSPDTGKGSALKIALILGLMIVMCLASVSQASALPGEGRLGMLARLFDFAGQLLHTSHSAETDLAGGSGSPAPELEPESDASDETAVVVETPAQENPRMEGGEPAETSQEPAYMPFMSFENFTDDQQ
jgi:hypothetical protein